MFWHSLTSIPPVGQKSRPISERMDLVRDWMDLSLRVLKQVREHSVHEDQGPNVASQGGISQGTSLVMISSSFTWQSFEEHKTIVCSFVPVPHCTEHWLSRMRFSAAKISVLVIVLITTQVWKCVGHADQEQFWTKFRKSTKNHKCISQYCIFKGKFTNWNLAPKIT